MKIWRASHEYLEEKRKEKKKDAGYASEVRQLHELQKEERKAKTN
jgi:hypothetical protein